MGERLNRGRILPREVVIEKLKQAVADISKQLPLDAVVIYGSYANCQPKFYSNVDVDVVSPACVRILYGEGYYGPNKYSCR